MRRRNRFSLIVRLGCFVYILLSASASYAQSVNQLPEIRNLQSDDPIFRQLQEDIAQFYQQEAQGKKIEPPEFFRYRVKSNDNLFSICAAANLAQETVATLNHLAHPDDISAGSEILIPSVDGLFIPKVPESDLEQMMIAAHANGLAAAMQVRPTPGSNMVFYFLPGVRFSPLERSYFLHILFRFPLPKGVITSGFGPRPDPFTGAPSFHHGIDIAAPIGTDVYAARDGVVISVSTDNELGLHIVLAHDGGFDTIYGHLSKTLVRLNQVVHSGTIIGLVGDTGMTTGPHLHFEVLERGKARDPEPLLPNTSK